MKNCEDTKIKYEKFVGHCREFKDKMAKFKKPNQTKGQLSELIRLKSAIGDKFDYILDSVIAPDRKYPERRALAKKLGVIFVSKPAMGIYYVQKGQTEFYYCDKDGSEISGESNIPERLKFIFGDRDPDLVDAGGTFYFQKKNGRRFPEKKEDYYDNAIYFNDGLALVNKGTKWFYIDIFGRQFSPKTLVFSEEDHGPLI